MCCERERGHFKPSRLRAEAHPSSPDVTGKVEPTQAGIGARVPEAITGRSCQSLLPAWNALGYRVPAAVSPLHLPPLLCGCFGDRRGLGDGGTPHSKHWDTGSAAKEKKRGLLPGLDPHHSLSQGWEATGPTPSTCREQKSQETCLVLQGKMTETGVNPQGICTSGSSCLGTPAP